MKQDVDTYTPDMYGELPTDVQTAVKTAKYRFYIVIADDNGGEHCTEWCGLSRKQARDMHAYTEKSHPYNVIRSGWEITR